MQHHDPQIPVGFNKHVGLRLTEWSMGHALVELDMEAHHWNGLGIAHGGVLLSALDFACGMCGSYRPAPEPRSFCMTVSLSTNFISPIRGGLLRAIGTKVGGGRSIFFAEARVLDEYDTLIATASGAFKIMKDRSASSDASKEKS